MFDVALSSYFLMKKKKEHQEGRTELVLFECAKTFTNPNRNFSRPSTHKHSKQPPGPVAICQSI